MVCAELSLHDRRLSSGLSGALKSDGRRRKDETAADTNSNEEPSSYSIHLSASTDPALRAGRRRLFQGKVGAGAVKWARFWLCGVMQSMAAAMVCMEGLCGGISPYSDMFLMYDVTTMVDDFGLMCILAEHPVWSGERQLLRYRWIHQPITAVSKLLPSGSE